MDDLCRLCLSRDKLINLFDTDIKEYIELRSIVLFVAGIEIQKNDEVPKTVCVDCCTCLIKICKFRRTAVSNDKALKMKFGQTYVPILLDEKSVNNINQWLNVNESQVDLKFDELMKTEKLKVTKLRKSSASESYYVVTKTSVPVHESVRALQNLYPKIILPNEVLNVDLNPKIKMRHEDSKAVEEWVKNEAKLQTLPGDIVVKKISGNDSCYNRYKTSIFQKINEESEVQKKEKKIEIDGKSELFKINGVVIKKVSENSSNVVKIAKKRSCEYSPSDLKPPQKKRVFTKESMAIPRLEVPSHNPVDSEMQKKLLTSSLELTTIAEASSIKSKKELEDSGKNLLTLQTKTVEVFVCKVCNKVFDNQRQLKYHSKVHLVCKICRMKFQTLKESLEHLHGGCPNMTTNLPWINIYRVDKILSVVAKYKETFDDFFAEIKRHDSIECESNMSEDTVCMNNSDCEVEGPDPNSIKVEELNVPRLSLASNFDDAALETVKVEDETEEETVESVSKIRPKVILVDEGSQFFDPPTLLTEDALLNSLFSYHNKVHAEAQTLPPKIKYINSNCILLENMVSELEHSRIPIEFTVSATINASFVQNNIKKEPPKVLFSWSHLNPVDICEKTQVSSKPAIPQKADNIQLAVKICNPALPPAKTNPKVGLVTNQSNTTTTLQQPTYYIINQPGTSTNLFNPQQPLPTVSLSSTPQTAFTIPFIVSSPLASTSTSHLIPSVPTPTASVNLPGIQHGILNQYDTNSIITAAYRHISPNLDTPMIPPKLPLAPVRSVKNITRRPNRSNHTETVFDPQHSSSIIIVNSNSPVTNPKMILPSPVPSVTDILKTPLIKSTTEQHVSVPSTSDHLVQLRVKKPWEVNASL